MCVASNFESTKHTRSKNKTGVAGIFKLPDLMWFYRMMIAGEDFPPSSSRELWLSFQAESWLASFSRLHRFMEPREEEEEEIVGEDDFENLVAGDDCNCEELVAEDEEDEDEGADVGLKS
jgi:hypothetical protein